MHTILSKAKRSILSIQSNRKYSSISDDCSISVAPTQTYGNDRGHGDSRKSREVNDESSRKLEQMKNERMQQMAGIHHKNPYIPPSVGGGNPSMPRSNGIPATFRNTIKSI